MAVPGLKEVFLPLLKFAADGKEHSVREAVEVLAGEFRLSEKDREKTTPGGIGVFENRVAWARSYVKQAGLLENPSRGRFRITPSGREVLAQNPVSIDVKFLTRFPEFVAFRNRSNQDADSSEQLAQEESRTPQELIESGYQRIRAALSSELLARVRECSPGFFERLVVDVLRGMGYGGTKKEAGRVVGGSHDGGIDGVIDEDALGLDVIYIQAKRWESTVGAKELRSFIGSLSGQKANKGVFITASSFSKEALDYIATVPHKVVLIDGERLVQLMIDHDVGVSKVQLYTVKRVDLDYFSEE